MLRVVLQILSAVNQALKEFSFIHLILTSAEVKQLEAVYEVLDTVAAGATELGSNDMDLEKADKVFEFLIRQLSQEESAFGSQMCESVSRRF